MLQAFLCTFGVIGLIVGIALGSGARDASGLFIGLTVVICSVMFCSAAAIVSAVASLRRPPPG